MRNSVIDKKSAAIVEAVSYWLGYQFKIGRSHLIHEASLRYPIADTITSLEIPIKRIVLEKLHPLFKGKRIDLVICDEDLSGQSLDMKDDKIKEYYEFKIANSNTAKAESIEHQRVFDDVLRLAYCHQWSQKDCYFLMCGKYVEFKTYFIGQKSEIKEQDGKKLVTPRKLPNGSASIDNREWQSNSIYQDWFSFKIGESKIIEFKNNSESEDEWGFQTFKKNYFVRNEIDLTLGESVKVKTTCLAITSPGLERTRTHAAGIWKIEHI